MIVEAVCCSADDCTAAENAGALRVELCMAIEVGGLTPSSALLKYARRHCRLPLMVMLRPRAGGFVYRASEIRVMGADLELMEEADGFVFGVLTDKGEIDMDACQDLCRKCGTREKVFHRAFDLVADPLAALKQLIDLGFTRVLTSGQAPSAEGGYARLLQLHDAAAGRIEILPGGGIRRSNAKSFHNGPWKGIHLGPRKRVADALGIEHEELNADELARVVELLAAAI